MQFEELTLQEFDNFVENNPEKRFWQCKDAYNFKKQNGLDVYLVGVKENDQIIAATMLVAYPLKFGFYGFEANRGLYVDYNNTNLLNYFIRQIKHFCAKHRGLYFRMDPYVCYRERDINGELVENGFNNEKLFKNFKQLGFKHFGFTTGDDNHFEPRWQFVLPLKGKSEEQLLKEMDQKTRNQIYATKRKGIEVRDLGLDEFDEFEKIMEHTANRRHFENRNDHFYRKQYEAYQDLFKVKVAQMNTQSYLDNLKVQKAELIKERDHHQQDYEMYPNHKKSLKKVNNLNEEINQNEAQQLKVKELEKKYGSKIIMAASFFVCYGNEVIYLYSGAYDHFLKYNPSVALQWDMITYALNHGYDRYNFYGISGNFKPGEEGYGVYNFKKGFNGHVEELMGVFELPVKKVTYHLYNGLKKVMGR